MNIVLIGSGNVAAVLGRKFKASGHHILQLYSRNTKTASELAYELDTESTNYKSTINPGADLYLVAVSDHAMQEVLEDLRFPGKVVAHTAASVPMDILQQVSTHYGVLYPLQSLRSGMQGLPEIPLYVEGNDEKASGVLRELAESISPALVGTASADERVKMHVAAVLVNNFTNYLYLLAETFCKREGIDFSQLQPLIEETATRIRTVSPDQVQTGPAIRGDMETIAKHMAILEKYPHIQAVYNYLTTQIQAGK